MWPYFGHKIFCLSIKTQNLSQKELRLIAKNKNICGYKIRRKDKLLRVIVNNEGDRKRLFKSKKEETKKILFKPTRNSSFKSKREKLREDFTSQQEGIFLNQK